MTDNQNGDDRMNNTELESEVKRLRAALQLIASAGFVVVAHIEQDKPYNRLTVIKAHQELDDWCDGYRRASLARLLVARDALETS